jgi:hypothetical protein
MLLSSIKKLAKQRKSSTNPSGTLNKTAYGVGNELGVAIDPKLVPLSLDSSSSTDLGDAGDVS